MKEEKWGKAKVEDFYKREEAGKGHTVMTIHNYRIYQTDFITFEKTPKTLVIDWKRNGSIVKVNLVQYYKEKYNLNVAEGQPMMVVCKNDDYQYLPCSICHEASLSQEVI
mmetsp:Transcript_29509/g.28669  ORF Transcript_29509/g.28669 Transcript_29509/m.28669 type:complete len:110 (+) Transcript_29509:601-930(+)